MSILVQLTHKTAYSYDRPVQIFPQVVRLRPAPHSRTPVVNYSLRVAPDHFLNWQQDPHGNYQARLVFPEKAKELSITVELTAELRSINPFDFFLEPSAETFPFTYAPELKEQLAPFLAQKEAGPLLSSMTDAFRHRKARTIDFLVELNQEVHSHVRYLIRLEPGVQPCEETLLKGSGSCRDSAYLLVQLLRSLGLAARFVSGYLIQLKADEVPVSGPAGPPQDFTDLHAWAEVYLPGAGWVGLDATSGLFTAEGHIPLACTPEPVDAAPITGSVEPCEAELSFEMHVMRVSETPRVTSPFSEEEWTAVESLAETVDNSLKARGVTLTIGGEPTFVSVDNRDSPEWNTKANGLNKKQKACELAFALHGRFAPGGALHSGQGKWYPGEDLPRWAYTIFARKDGMPVWRNASLLAHDMIPGRSTNRDAENFIRTLARRLVGHDSTVIPGYEDAYYYLWKENSLPLDVDLHKKDLDSDAERKRLFLLLDRGPAAVTGFALPLFHDGIAFRTGSWEFRRGRMILIPGDSAMGYRLPLGSLSGTPPRAEEISPTVVRPPFGDYYAVAERRRQHFEITKSAGPSAESPQQQNLFVSHTALCAEVRDGNLRIFLPPLWNAEQYLDLIAAIEMTAEDLGIPAALEGYEPAYDARLRRISVTPDPGVIEVNIDPSENFKEHREKLEALYEEARAAGLTAEKFMLDGRRAGTGGGNHITLGGVHPSESVFLQSPRLLADIVVFFQNHPAFSYFFSGLFTGPTSQSPRVDEGHPGALYDLALSLTELRGLTTRGGEYPMWLSDRLLRHLLTDHTGNTHRTEISIDKLYSPDSMSGRLGLLEFRAFEMPYHPRMNALQGLLLRAIVAAFLDRPLEGRPVEIGRMLQDRYRLPAFLFEDLTDALSLLASRGLAFNPDWFGVFREGRFPLCGSFTADGIKVEIRTAVEHWQVLGEEMFLHGTARAVDSAVERVEVRTFDMKEGRYSIFCNGREVPLSETRTAGSFAGGVRFKAWAPPSTMHPSIAAEQELVFELVDNLTDAVVSAATWSVVHPGGRAYDTLPVNEREAESRVISRFHKGGKSSQRIRGGFDPAAPHTLDLRKRPGT